MAELGGTKKSIGSSPANFDGYNSLNSSASETMNFRALRAAVNQKDQTLGELEDRIAFL